MGLSVPVDPALARSIYNPAGLGFMPPSTPWLTDTMNGLDLYRLGFGMTPTIHFDPAAAETSRNLGTYQNPYTTTAQLQARCAGFMGGQVLGVKRGSFVRGTLALTCYGASGAPFVIVPYGDALAMPVFSGGTVRTAWSAYPADPRIWQLSGVAQAVDLFAEGERLFAVAGANLAAKIAPCRPSSPPLFPAWRAPSPGMAPPSTPGSPMALLRPSDRWRRQTAPTPSSSITRTWPAPALSPWPAWRGS